MAKRRKTPETQARQVARKPGSQFTQSISRWLYLAIPLVLVFFFWNVLAGKRFFWEDILQQFYPTLSYLANSLRHLKLPYWTPYVFSGMPFINDVQSLTFYPFHWVLPLFIRSDGRLAYLAVELIVIVHLCLTGLFMYRLAREWKLAREAALFSALCLMLSGFMIVRTIHYGVILTITWFPLILLLFHRSLYERKLSAVLGAGLVTGLAALGGYPQTLLHMGYALALYALFFIIFKWREWRFETVWRGVVGLGIVVVVGVGIAAVQYLPSIEYVKHTLRTSLSYKDLVEASLQPVQLLTLLAPKFFGSITGSLTRTDTVFFWLARVDYPYWETVIYVGIVPLILGLFALSDRKQPLRWFAFTLAVVALVLALGKYTPLYKLALLILPGFKRFRIPGRLSDLFTFGIAVLAGFGMDFLLRSASDKAGKKLVRILLIALGVAVLVWVMLAAGAFRGLSAKFTDAQVYANSVRQWGFFVLFLVAGAAILFFRTVRNTPGVFYLLLAVTMVDLFAFGYSYNSSVTGPDQFYQRNETINRWREEERQEPFRINSRNDYAMLLGRNQGNVDFIELLEGYTPLGLARYSPFTRPTPRMLDLLNARFKADSMGRRIVANPTWLPRARMVYQYQLAVSDSEALRMLKADSFNYRDAAIVEQDPGFASRAADSAGSQVKLLAREANRMELEVTTAQTGMLVLSEVFYPEWKAKLDGGLVEIYPADFVLRGVTIPAGTHRLEMWYDGTRVARGARVSLLTLVLTIGLMVLLRVRSRRRKRHEPEVLTKSVPGLE